MQEQRLPLASFRDAKQARRQVFCIVISNDDVGGSRRSAGHQSALRKSCQIVKFGSKPRIRKLLIAAGIGLAIACMLLPASYWFAPSLLCLRDNEAAADAIVLLGGECFHRPTQAAELFKKGLAPNIKIG